MEDNKLVRSPGISEGLNTLMDEPPTPPHSFDGEDLDSELIKAFMRNDVQQAVDMINNGADVTSLTEQERIELLCDIADFAKNTVARDERAMDCDETHVQSLARRNSAEKLNELYKGK